MTKKILILLLLSVAFLPGLMAQDTLPTLSAIQYQIQTDSLSRTNIPQDLSLTITAGSVGNRNNLILNIDNVSAFWTVVSANLNNQTLWLINSQTPSERENVLAWNYNKEEKSLYLYPTENQLSSDLNLVVRLNLLKANEINNKSATTVNLIADVGNIRYQCVPTGAGNGISFR